MFNEELSSFLSQFQELRRAGLTAHLDVDTCAGKAWVGLRVMLGPVQHPHHHPQNVQNVKRRSPSYYRRQERRKAARAAEVPSSVVVDAEQAKETVEVPENKVQESDDKKAGKASDLDYDCELCDFSSNRKAGLNVHMARKHALFEQLDGNVELSEDSRDVAHDDEIEHYLKTGELGVHVVAWDRLLQWLKMLNNKEEIVIAFEARKAALEKEYGRGSYIEYRPWCHLRLHF